MNAPVIVILGPHRAAISGVSTHVNLLMGSALREDYELVHFQVGSEGRDEGAAGRLLRLLASPFALFATILFRHASLVHINTSLNPRAYWRDLSYLFVAKLLRARVVYQVHGGELPQDFFKGRRALTAFLRWTLGLPDLVAVLASTELEAYERFVPEQDVIALPNGIDCRPFAHIPTAVTQPADALRLVYVGRIAREKGLYEALQAMRLALELGVDARLTVAGAGPEEPRLRRYAAALGHRAAHHVRRAGVRRRQGEPARRRRRDAAAQLRGGTALRVARGDGGGHSGARHARGRDPRRGHARHAWLPRSRARRQVARRSARAHVGRSRASSRG